MCTLTLAWRVFDDVPVVVAANRDESTDRPSTPPHVGAPSVDDSDAPRVLAPRDELAGGTWMGVTDAGVFAGITNRWTDSALAADRSRGLLVDDALTAATASDAAAVVRRAVADHEYAGFYLTIVDASDAILLGWDGELTETHLSPGVHVVVNVGADDDFDVPSFRRESGNRQARNARRARAELAVRDSESVDAWLDRASAVLRDHNYGLCIHGDGYGTRSSALVTIDASGAVTYAHADGPPCRTPFSPVEHDL